MARALVRAEIVRMAGDVRSLRVLGLGFATPYIRVLLPNAERVLAFMPAGRDRPPGRVRVRRTLCSAIPSKCRLPTRRSIFIAVHAFEHTSDAEEQMRELWRVTAPNGRLIVVVPRRGGLWSRFDTTPFGWGNPYRRSSSSGCCAITRSLPNAGAMRST